MPQERNLKKEYEMRIAATERNLRMYLNESLGIIRKAQAGEMPEEDGMLKLDEAEKAWAIALVNDLAPEEHIIKEL